MKLSPENLRIFWEKAKEFPTLFGMDIHQDFKSFLETLVKGDPETEVYSTGLFWRVDDFVGICYLTNITEADAHVHYSFFDRRHKGRLGLIRALILHVFRRYGFRRLTAELPLYSKNTVIPFVEALGFTREGRRRKAALYDNEWFDVALYGLLSEEAATWPQAIG